MKYKFTGTIDGIFEGTIEEVLPITYPCTKCSEIFNTQEELDAHILSDHPVIPPVVYACLVVGCGAEFQTQDELDAHTLSAHPVLPPVYKCSVCGLEFPNQTELNKHITDTHPPVSGYFRVTGPGQYLPTNPQEYPVLYGSYTDMYGHTVRRMTNESVMTKPNYPARTSTLENADGTMFAICRRGGYPGCAWHVFTVADGTRRCDFSAWTYNSNRADDMFVWSPTEPNVAYFFSASHGYPDHPARFYRMTINTTTWAISAQLLYTFTPELLPSPPVGVSLNAVLNHDEGPASWDGRYWAFRMACTGDGSQNLTTIALLFDRDLNGFEQPGIKGWTLNQNPERIAYCLGISPGGNYLFWRVKGMAVMAYPTATMIGEVQSSNFIKLNKYAVQAHYSLGYDDLGNEVYVAPGNWVYKYYIFGQTDQVGIVICPKDWWRGAVGYSAVHSVTCGVIPGPREWMAIINTSGGAANECGYEGTDGAATITYCYLSATKQKVFRVAHERNEASGSYPEECFAGSSRDGNKMYFQSNWCNTKITQTFRVELPANWWEELI